MATVQSSTSEAESSLNAELLIELVRQFPVIWNPKLNYIKDHAKKKNAWIQISTVLGVLHCTNLFLAIIWLSIIQVYLDLLHCLYNVLFWRRGKWKVIIFFHTEFSALKNQSARKFWLNGKRKPNQVKSADLGVGLCTMWFWTNINSTNPPIVFYF